MVIYDDFIPDYNLVPPDGEKHYRNITYWVTMSKDYTIETDGSENPKDDWDSSDKPTIREFFKKINELSEYILTQPIDEKILKRHATRLKELASDWTIAEEDIDDK